MKQLIFAGVIAALFVGSTFTAEPPAKLDALLAVIKPQPDEDRWAKIAWRTDLWAARQEAAEKGKPILLWEMDGHPLGCV